MTLTNGGFENGMENWTPWIARADDPNGGQPEFNIETEAMSANLASRRSGAGGLRIKSSWFCWWAGVYQQIRVVPSSKIRLSAWGKPWATDRANEFPKYHNPNVRVWVTVGIDTQGGTDPLNSGVRWKKIYIGLGEKEFDGFAYTHWTQAVTDGVAQSNMVTLFAGMDLGGQSEEPPASMWAQPAMVGFLDDVVVAIGLPGDEIPPPIPPSGNNAVGAFLRWNGTTYKVELPISN